jgi:hypothetical protein
LLIPEWRHSTCPFKIRPARSRGSSRAYWWQRRRSASAGRCRRCCGRCARTTAAFAPATGLPYAANTMGAVVGTLATPFLLVPAFGIIGTGISACALQLAAAGGAVAVD